MENPARQKKSRAAACVLAAAACALIALGGRAATQAGANRPDHGGFTDCRPCHAEKYKMWEASGHSKAITRIADLPNAGADCFGCHSAEGFGAKLAGGKVDPADKGSFHTVSCLACHKPGDDTHPKQLAADAETLCGSCHSQRSVLQGKGAKGVEDTRSFHSGVACVSCHMSEGNHYMKVMRPDDPSIPEDRLDTCTRCHKDNNRKTRAKQLPDWQAFYKEAMEPVEADLAAIDAALKQKPDALGAELLAKLNVARANLAIVQRDGSKGAHNLDFSLEIAAQAKKSLKEVKAALAGK
ncbi:MAG: hypothetical protein LBT74_12915 [Acidobacteriota bacterium]|nr:hypothetical protein [Acidobacteriota bacterium]